MKPAIRVENNAQSNEKFRVRYYYINLQLPETTLLALLNRVTVRGTVEQSSKYAVKKKRFLS